LVQQSDFVSDKANGWNKDHSTVTARRGVPVTRLGFGTKTIPSLDQ
jgi:hypothetical protein